MEKNIIDVAGARTSSAASRDAELPIIRRSTVPQERVASVTLRTISALLWSQKHSNVRRSRPYHSPARPVIMIASTRAMSFRGRDQSDAFQGPEKSSATHRMSEGCVGDFLL